MHPTLSISIGALMQLTLFTEYSLRVLMYLSANPNKLCTANEIAEHHGISRHHLGKIIHNLAQCGYINSTRGNGGGIQLSKEPEAINLRDLIIQLEPNFTLVECFDAKHNTCRITKICGLSAILSESLDAFKSTLGRYTLADTTRIKSSNNSL